MTARRPHFPTDFLWGAATAPYRFGIARVRVQTDGRGAWNEYVDCQMLNRTVKESGWWYRDWIRGTPA